MKKRQSACVRGLDHIAVKVASGFFDNPRLGLPSSGAMVVALSAKTGFCEAVMLDNAYLADLRTGLAGAVAVRYLAPEMVRTVGVLGSGAQARNQVRALRLARDFERVLVSSRDADRSAAYAAEMGESLGLPVEAATPEALVRESELVITTTPATSSRSSLTTGKPHFSPVPSAGLLHVARSRRASTSNAAAR